MMRYLAQSSLEQLGRQQRYFDRSPSLDFDDDTIKTNDHYIREDFLKKKLKEKKKQEEKRKKAQLIGEVRALTKGRLQGFVE